MAFGGFRTEPVDCRVLASRRWTSTRGASRASFTAEDGVPFTLSQDVHVPARLVPVRAQDSTSKTRANELPAPELPRHLLHARNWTADRARLTRAWTGATSSATSATTWTARRATRSMRRDPVLAARPSASTGPRSRASTSPSSRFPTPPCTQSPTTSRKDPELVERTALFFSRPLITSSKQHRHVPVLRRPPEARDSEPLQRTRRQRSVRVSATTTSRRPPAPIPIIGWLANILRFFLDFFYRLIPNYGVAIILLTVLIKILFFPAHPEELRVDQQDERCSRPKIEETQEEVPGQTGEAEPGDDGAVPQGRRQPGGRLSPAAVADADLLRPVRVAQQCVRPARSAVHRALDRRPVGAGKLSAVRVYAAAAELGRVAHPAVRDARHHPAAVAHLAEPRAPCSRR